VALSLGWALANGSLKSFDIDHRFEGEEMSSISTNWFGMGLFARPAAMANCYVAASDDAYGVLYNPAGMAWVPNFDFALGYQSRFDRLNNFAASFAAKATRDFGFGNALLYSGDYDGLQSELYFLSSYAYKINRLLPFLKPMSIGATVKVINKRTPQTDNGSVSQNTIGVGLDLGFMTQLADHIKFGFVFKDVPTMEKVDNDRFRYVESSPPQLHVGGSYQAGYSTFLICEGQIPLYADQNWMFAGGVEQEIFQIFLIRAGLRKQVSFDTPWLITGGFGTKIKTESLIGKYVIVDGSYEYNTLGLFPVTNVSFRMGF
jgi:hypothetical protein